MRPDDESKATVVAAGAPPAGFVGVLADTRWTLYVGLIVLNILDVVTTKLVLDRGGSERNPFVEPFVEGMWDITAAKLAVLAIIGVLLVRCHNSRPADIALAVTTGWYLAVVMWNFAVLALL